MLYINLLILWHHMLNEANSSLYARGISSCCSCCRCSSINPNLNTGTDTALLSSLAAKPSSSIPYCSSTSSKSPMQPIPIVVAWVLQWHKVGVETGFVLFWFHDCSILLWIQIVHDLSEECKWTTMHKCIYHYWDPIDPALQDSKTNDRKAQSHKGTCLSRDVQSAGYEQNYQGSYSDDDFHDVQACVDQLLNSSLLPDVTWLEREAHTFWQCPGKCCTQLMICCCQNSSCTQSAYWNRQFMCL